jgi:hypothetical protein
MAFVRKIGVWGDCVQQGKFYIFLCLSIFLVLFEDSVDEIKVNIKQMIISDLGLLHRKSVHYFSAEEKDDCVECEIHF